MAFRLNNPFFKSDRDTKLDAIESALVQHMQTVTNKKTFTLNDLKTALPSFANDLTRDNIITVCLRNGWDVDVSE